MGPLIIISGPSGSGKSTLIDRLLASSSLPLHLSVSATTRPPRPGEVDGKNYHFLSRERFEQMRRDGEFLESAEVFGNWYGTPRSEVEPFRAKGQGVVLEIDVQGADQVRARCPDAVSIFLRASSIAAYEDRLRRRGTEDETKIQKRLEGAQRELACAVRYTHTVVNDDLDQAVALVRDIIQAHFQGTEHAR